MKFEKIKIKNFKSLKKCEVNLSELSCIIGKNNSGKSSFLKAIDLLINDYKVDENYYYDKSKNIEIEVFISEITSNDLDKLSDSNRIKYIHLIKDNKLVLKREIDSNFSSKLKILKSSPKDPRLHTDNIESKLKGKSNLRASELKDFVNQEFGLSHDEGITSIASAKSIINLFVEQLPESEMELIFSNLPSGIDNSIKNFLPKVLFIPAVKDFSDEMKNKSTTIFGKILKTLLTEVRETISLEYFEKIEKEINAATQIKTIENKIRENINETFDNINVEIVIPSPNIDDIFSNTSLYVDDGFKGDCNEKGDGLRRTIIFSLLNVYNEIKISDSRDMFLGENIFLFEEPELYLHPHAQNILYETLMNLSKKNQVIFSTHSPNFFSPENLSSFIKFEKNNEDIPYTKTYEIDLNEINNKEKFQLISYESNNCAFFSKKVLLVEGDSELIVIPKLAKELNTDWDFKSNSIGIIKTNGKDSMKRYKEFFNLFDIEVFMLCDLDILLRSYNKIDPDSKYLAKKNDLLRKVEESIENQSKPKTRKYKKVLERGESRSLFELIKNAREQGNIDEVYELMEEFYSFESQNIREEILQNPNDEIKEIKNELFASLIQDNIFILSLGEIEDYYDSSIEGNDKPTKALNFCKFIKDRDNLFDWLSDSDLANTDFNNLFSALFKY